MSSAYTAEQVSSLNAGRKWTFQFTLGMYLVIAITFLMLYADGHNFNIPDRVFSVVLLQFMLCLFLNMQGISSTAERFLHGDSYIAPPIFLWNEVFVRKGQLLFRLVIGVGFIVPLTLATFLRAIWWAVSKCIISPIKRLTS
jgi:hypothetical protein